jgi:hypothetical protein
MDIAYLLMGDRLILWRCREWNIDVDEVKKAAVNRCWFFSRPGNRIVFNLDIMLVVY